MQYARCPRPSGLNLEREQLRVYMMCDGRRELGEVASLTRLDLGTVMRVIQELLGLRLLEAVLTPIQVEFPAAPGQPDTAHLTQTAPVVAPMPLPGDQPAPPATDLLPQLETVLTSHLGARAEPFIQQLQACQDGAQLREQAARTVVKLKLTVNRSVADAFNQALQASAL